jgi:hypothetical protein
VKTSKTLVPSEEFVSTFFPDGLNSTDEIKSGCGGMFDNNLPVFFSHILISLALMVMISFPEGELTALSILQVWPKGMTSLGS